MMKRMLVASTAFFVSSSLSYAAPTVTDTTISWPDNGWYQVQNADTYDSICGGTGFCDVEPGIYNVINHTTGERFENIVVGLSNEEAGPIVVSGNTISWPDDGWYQVQRSDDYETICNGGRSCSVEAGVYVVINHTSGERFTNVVVSGEAGLTTFGNSEAFFSALKQALINENKSNSFDVDAPLVSSEPVADFDGDGLGNLQNSAIAAPATESAASDAGGVAGNDVTSTNVQELGVDEQDRVKVNAAGTRLFVLSEEYGDVFPVEPVFEPEFLLESDPVFAPDLAVGFPPDVDVIDNTEPVSEPLEMGSGELANSSVPVEPPPLDEEELILVDVEADSLSIAPYPEQITTMLTVYGLDSETPTTTDTIEFPVDLKGRTADGFYLYEKDGNSSAIVTASGGGYWGYWGQSTAFSGRQSVVAKVDVTDSSNISLSETFTIDGQIVSSRRIGDKLFFASRYYPLIPGLQPWNQSSEQWREAVENADLAELMPVYTRNGSEESTPLVEPSSCFVAGSEAESTNYSPDIITMGVIDLATMELQDSQCYLGATETLYASTESVFLATTQYDYSFGPVTIDDQPVDTDVIDLPVDISWFDPRTTTEIHQFDINEDSLSYAGSGSVNGHLGWNDKQKPYRMSESNGYLRVATMNDQQGPEHSPILVSILKADGLGNLETISSLPNESRPEFIGKPGERLYASRFLGDRGYLVTFRQTDPLYVLNLENPADPIVEGELEIQGYSDYLTPVDENHLLGIGMDAVAADNGGFGDGRGAVIQGIKLSLFDVTDPAAPTEVQSVLLGERGSNSVAVSNPRAITIQAANDQHPMRVSFGASIHGKAFPISSPEPANAWDYSPWSYTGLHGFDVTGGPNASITTRGALVTATNDGSQRRGGNYWNDRSVMVNDAVFYVNDNKVYSALWDSLASPTP